MTLRATLAALIATCAGGTIAAQPPTFRTGIDAVRVDVLVSERGRPVRGLAASDFEVRDNGVRQQVEVITFEQLPLNVVLALDVSGSLTPERLGVLRAAGLTVLDHLRPEDQAALITFSEVVSRDAPLTRDHSETRRALEAVRSGGRTSLIDATYAGIVVGDTKDDRSLLIIFTDGVDTSSWLSEDSVLKVAGGSDVVVYAVAGARNAQHGFAGRITAMTGGSVSEIGATDELSAAFLRVIAEFRHRYLLSYTPRGVRRGGWHRLEVRVKGGRYTVRSRSGYLDGS